MDNSTNSTSCIETGDQLQVSGGHADSMSQASYASAANSMSSTDFVCGG